MNFAIRADARDWFKYLDGDKKKMFPIAFDAYYYCLIAGLATRQKKDSPTKTEDILEYFPEPYKTWRKLLIALFLSRELELLGVEMKDKQVVYKVIGKLVDPEQTNHLSAAGMKEFNKYSHGGFEVIKDWFNNENPRTLETFLLTFKKNIDKAFNS